MYNLIQTIEARNDLDNLVFYMIYSLMNGQAASHFLVKYKKQIQNLTIFPFAYRGTGITYRGEDGYSF